MSELSSLFGIISEGKKQAAAEKAERIRIEEERKKRLEPQVEVELNDLSEFFSVLSTKKKIDALPKETKQEVQQLEVLSSFFEQMSKFETSLDSAIKASEKEPEVVHIRSGDGRGPLWWAYEHKNKKIVKLLKKHGADKNALDSEGKKPKDMFKPKRK